VLSILPTAVYPFLFAVIAAIAASVFGRQSTSKPFALVSAVLYALAVACVIIGVITIFLDRAT